MFYAEINESGFCYHVTASELPLGEFVLKVDSPSVLGKIWDGENWNEPEQPEPEPAEPTQLDRVEEMLNALTSGTVSADVISEAIEEGVNEV